MKYCELIHRTERFLTRVVKVGNVGVGGDNPVRIQSMTTSSTRDVQATIDQVIRLADAGCEIARVTVQGMKEADACEEIKNGLLQKGYTIPLVADIHFYPPAAMRVVDSVDKVRINPGNFVDKRASFKVIEYNDASYAEELERLEEKFTPLVEKCKKLKRSMRIGTNHGSLSDRIMNRFGDTPRGMVESAFEFTRVARKNDYHDIIFSMKASNPVVMIEAYRLLVAEMYLQGWNYPLHLGVTEAGSGEDGRIKSAMGIGSLLLDGIGDTIRVSLTEDPWYEIDPCKRLVKFAESYQGKGVDYFEELHRSVEGNQKRVVEYPKHISMHRDGTVLAKVSKSDLQAPNFYQKIGMDVQLGKPKLKIASLDAIVLAETQEDRKIIDKLQEIGVSSLTFSKTERGHHGQVLIQTLKEALEEQKLHKSKERFTLMPKDLAILPLALLIQEGDQPLWDKIKEVNPSLILLKPEKNKLHYSRAFFEWLKLNAVHTPVILNFAYDVPQEDLVIQASAEMGALLADHLGDGVFIEGPYEVEFLRNLSFNLLQAARMRTSKTDFISCPSCGRTLFDLQEVTKGIQAKTAHLPGVKIAIMGCIVNGPGEMADADFGYVGSKPGKIDLYVGKTCVQKDIDFADAVESLVELIKTHGRWVEPEIELLEESVK